MVEVMDDRAQQIISLRDQESLRQANFRDLWQQSADLMYPCEDQITSKRTPGEDLSRRRYDSTAVRDSQDMASGLSAALIPTGQKFFELTVNDKRLHSIDIVRRYLSLATEITHAELFRSNFMLQLNESLRSLVVFGTNIIYSEWDQLDGGLNFRDYPIWTAQIKENAKGNVDVVMLTYHMSARQAMQEFGTDEVDAEIKDAASKLETESRKFEFIHYVGPRRERNSMLKDNHNMPWESLFIDVKHKSVVEDGGYDEMSFAVARWMKRASEKWGRGQGTENLADVKVLNQMQKDFIDLCDRFAHPPLLVDQNWEGEVQTHPGAVNRVMSMDSIRGMQQDVLGNFPITEKALDQQRQLVHDGFFRDIFRQLADLTTTHHTAVEVMERVREGLRRLAQPVSRLQSELLNPIIMRSVLLLIRNGRIPYPPAELQGQSFGIEYMGQLALALRDQQAQGFIRFAQFCGQMEQVFPGSTDWINADTGMPFMATSMGVRVDDISTSDQVAAKRQQRQAQMQAQMAMQAAQVAGKAYKDSSGAPEQGSPAGELMGAMNG